MTMERDWVCRPVSLFGVAVCLGWACHKISIVGDRLSTQSSHPAAICKRRCNRETAQKRGFGCGAIRQPRMVVHMKGMPQCMPTSDGGTLPGHTRKGNLMDNTSRPWGSSTGSGYVRVRQPDILVQDTVALSVRAIQEILEPGMKVERLSATRIQAVARGRFQRQRVTSCPICFQMCLSSEAVALAECDHRLCFSCAFRCEQDYHQCPMCRKPATRWERRQARLSEWNISLDNIVAEDMTPQRLIDVDEWLSWTEEQLRQSDRRGRLVTHATSATLWTMALHDVVTVALSERNDEHPMRRHSDPGVGLASTRANPQLDYPVHLMPFHDPHSRQNGRRRGSGLYQARLFAQHQPTHAWMPSNGQRHRGSDLGRRRGSDPGRRHGSEPQFPRRTRAWTVLGKLERLLHPRPRVTV